METKIVGQKHLDSNLYERIIIGNKQKDKNTILITAKTEKYKNVETIKTTSKTFMESIKDIREEYKLEEIVDYFLRNNIIYTVKEDNGIMALSTSGRKLHCKAYFKKDDYQIVRKLNNLIIEKYKNDRLLFLEANKEVKNYRITTSANIIAYNQPGDFVELSLLSLRQQDKSWELAEFEEKFLKEFIYEKIVEENEYATIKYRECYNSYFGEIFLSPCFKIYCGELEFYLYDFSRKLERELGIMIMNYNYSREENLKRQLKLEGI